MIMRYQRIIPIPDSFVIKSNKLSTSTGNGEGKLYIGQKSDYKIKSFFGAAGAKITLIFSKHELIDFLNLESQRALENPKLWHGGERLPKIYAERRSLMAKQPSRIELRLVDDVLVGGPRRYIRPLSKSGDNANLFRDILRGLPLSGTACLVLEKRVSGQFTALLVSADDDEVQAMIERTEAEAEILRITTDPKISPTTRKSLVDSRIGQGVFKEGIRRKDGSACALTGVSEKTLLIASHIKSWNASSDFERLDPQNGLLLSPDADKLFDLGLISFADDGSLLVSSRLAVNDLQKCGIDIDMKLQVVVEEPRAKYLAYHRNQFGF